MSTLSFQDFVRERMLKRRQDAMSEASRFPDDAVDMPIIGSYQRGAAGAARAGRPPPRPSAPAAAPPSRRSSAAVR